MIWKYYYFVFFVGCLFKEFSENVYNEVKRLKENVQEEPCLSESVQEEAHQSSEASSESELENSNTFDIDEGVDLDKTNDCDEEIQKLFSGKNVSYTFIYIEILKCKLNICFLCKTRVIALRTIEMYISVPFGHL